ncbi:MAG: LacI family DNA-binding transcriptional regulator [Atopobiaceae bacterium]|jgi:LacI family sucrose operon transcriptional repressor
MDINTIAAMAGVSRATVSRYLNDGYVSDEKRARIARVIKKTGYVPSRQAQTLRTGRTNVVGVIIPKINSASISSMVAGITSVLGQANYQILLANTDNVATSEVDYLKLFSDTGSVDGIILVATILTPAHQEMLEALELPHVVLGQRSEGHRCVYFDDFHALHDIALHALVNGERPAYLGVTEADAAAGHARHEGFLAACSECGITPLGEELPPSDFTIESGYLSCERLLDAHPNIDTIICATDRIAAGAMACLREYGKQMPHEIQITGLGDSDLARVMNPTLTTVRYHYTEAGTIAAQMLLDALGKGKESAKRVCMDYDLYARDSTRWSRTSQA